VSDGQTPALLTRVDRSAYDVLTPTGPARVPALPAPPDPLDAPTVGDWLELVGCAVAGVLPRRSLLSRGAKGGHGTAQPLAANIDIVLICVGLAGPLALRRLERLLTLSWDSGATPVVVLTKADLCRDVDQAVRAVQPHAPGADVVTVCAALGDVHTLMPYVGDGATGVLLGASGAGKSTVVNALLGASVMATGDLRQVYGKGRHTTTHRELLILPTGGVVIDTPGLREVALAGAGAGAGARSGTGSGSGSRSGSGSGSGSSSGSGEGLSRAFSDVEDLAAACRFADCAHVGEPGCAVLASITAGDLGQDRVDSWRALQRELAFQARRGDARLRAQESRTWKALSRAKRAREGRP